MEDTNPGEFTPNREADDSDENELSSRNVVAAEHGQNLVGTSSDVVEVALANAITEATSAKRFDVVAQLCRELEARRLARTPNVVSIDSKRGGSR